MLDFATGGLEPDLIVLLEAPLELVEDPPRAASAIASNPSRSAFHERVRDGYRTLAAADPDRWAVIDGAGSIDEVSQRVLDAVNARFPAP